MALDWLYLAYVVVREGQGLDWDAALRLIEKIDPDDVYADDVDNVLYAWEDFEELTPGEPQLAPLDAYYVTRRAREILVLDLVSLRDVVENPRVADREFTVVRVPEHRIYLTGVLSDGSRATFSYNGILRLAKVGALAAAGFHGFQDAPAGGKAKLTRKQRRRAASGRAALHSEDDAARLIRAHPEVLRAPAQVLYGRLSDALAEMEALADEATREWLASRRKRYPRGPAINDFLVGLMRYAAEGVLWASTLQGPDVVEAPSPWALTARQAADSLWGNTPSRPRDATPTYWHAELRDYLDYIEPNAVYLDGGLSREDRTTLERESTFGDIAIDTGFHLWRTDVAFALEALGYLSPRGLRPFRANDDMAPLTDPWEHDGWGAEGDAYGEELAVIGAADPDLRWEEATRVAADANLSAELETLHGAVSRFRRDVQEVPVPGGWVMVLAERGNQGEPWLEIVRSLRRAGVLESLGATLADPLPRRQRRERPHVKRNRGRSL